MFNGMFTSDLYIYAMNSNNFDFPLSHWLQQIDVFYDTVMFNGMFT